jgi:hypothetical protein
MPEQCPRGARAVPKQRPSNALFEAIVAAHDVALLPGHDAIGRMQRKIQQRGSPLLRTKIALCAGLLAFGVSASERALAQPVPPYYPGAVYPGPVYPGYARGLPPHEIVAVVRSAGLDPLSRPMRRGPVYALLAVDRAGQEFRVTVDARLGRVLRIVPMPGARFAAPVVVPPTPYGRPPGGIAMVPDGYGPNSRIAALPSGGEGPPENGPGLTGVPTGPGYAPAVGAAPRPAVQAGPPLPRPRPKLAATATDPSTSKPAAGAAPQVSQSRQAGTKGTTGAVTPPPEE